MQQRAVYKKVYHLRKESGVQQKWLVSVFNRAGINMSELADKLHITRQSVSTWMTGKVTLPYMAICAICHVLKLPDNCERLYSAIIIDQEK